MLLGVVWLAVIVAINTYVGYEAKAGDDNYGYGFNKVHSVQKAIDKMRYDVVGENKSRNAEIEFRKEYVKGVSSPEAGSALNGFFFL